MESPISFTGHQEAREICLRGGKSGFPDVILCAREGARKIIRQALAILLSARDKA